MLALGIGPLITPFFPSTGESGDWKGFLKLTGYFKGYV